VEKFERALRLPKGVDPEAISARLEDGILELTLGKVEELKPYQIEIQ
jgi:HSP20 family molecular chaperone IbpA